MKFRKHKFQEIYFALLIEMHIFSILLILNPLKQHDTLPCEILYFRIRNISSILSLKFLFVKWFRFHLYLSILTCKFQEVYIFNVTSPNTSQNRRNETACIMAFLSPSYANQMRAQSLDYVLSPLCISTATQIQITFSVFPQNLFHICLHLLICDFCAQPLLTSKQQFWLTHSRRSNKYMEHLNSCMFTFHF